MDISYNCENQKFNYRVCAMIIAENKIEQNRCATALAGHRAAILFNSNLTEQLRLN